MAEGRPLPPLILVTVSSGQRLEEILGSFLTPANSLVFYMAEGRPIPPLVSVAVTSGRHPQVVFNLQALKPLRRPSGSSAAGSRLTAPSGSVPGDGEVDCAAQQICGGEGAGLDCFSNFSSKAISAKGKDLVVIFYFRGILFVNCISTDE
jgi:hypothetical protein